jgi:hypothetical protein
LPRGLGVWNSTEFEGEIEKGKGEEATKQPTRDETRAGRAR